MPSEKTSMVLTRPMARASRSGTVQLFVRVAEVAELLQPLDGLRLRHVDDLRPCRGEALEGDRDVHEERQRRHRGLEVHLHAVVVREEPELVLRELAGDVLERRELGNGHVPGPGTHHLHVRLDAALHLEEEVGERIEAARRVLVLDLDLLDERVLHDLHIVASLGDFRLAGLGDVSFHAKGPGHTRNTARRGEREARRSEAEVAVDVLRHLDGHPGRAGPTRGGRRRASARAPAVGAPEACLVLVVFHGGAPCGSKRKEPRRALGARLRGSLPHLDGGALRSAPPRWAQLAQPTMQPHSEQSCAARLALSRICAASASLISQPLTSCDMSAGPHLNSTRSATTFWVTVWPSIVRSLKPVPAPEL